jgi:hypothetical protein
MSQASTPRRRAVRAEVSASLADTGMDITWFMWPKVGLVEDASDIASRQDGDW